MEAVVKLDPLVTTERGAVQNLVLNVAALTYLTRCPFHLLRIFPDFFSYKYGTHPFAPKRTLY